jgi:hypothetical protein
MNATEQRIDVLLQGLLRMSDAELRLLHLGWEEVSAEERDSAWQTVRGVVRRDPGKKYMEAAQSRLAKWVNNSATWTGFGFGQVATGTGSGMNLADVRTAALPAVLDAVGEIIAEDQLSDDQREALLEPWHRVVPQTNP